MGWFPLFLRRSALGSICGHPTKLKGTLSAFGETIKMKINLREDGSTPYCLDCLAKMSIRCGWCGKPIFIADVVTLYSPTTTEEFNARWKEDLPFTLVEDAATGLRLPETAVVYQPTQGRTRPTIVGCGRTSCAESGADYAGTWLPGKFGKGYAQRIRTPYEQLLNAEAGTITNVR
ncbi:hypothetical protein JNK62_04440 [bacterium]|nr:hypothetical protein [bacterium]